MRIEKTLLVTGYSLLVQGLESKAERKKLLRVPCYSLLVKGAQRNRGNDRRPRTEDSGVKKRRSESLRLTQGKHATRSQAPRDFESI